MNPTPPNIVIKGLNVSYGDKVVFKDFDISFASGRISALLGGSGVGKTTLLNAIAGLLDFGGEIAKGEGAISYIFQRDRLVPGISVYKNLELVLKSVIKDRQERKKRIYDMLELLEIADEAKKLPAELSGGQAQRVAMARAYLYPSDILLLDEPFKALDTALKARLLDQLVRLNRLSPRTIVFVTHAIDECLLLADDYFVLGENPAVILSSGAVSATDRRLSSKELSGVREELLRALSL